VSARYDYFSHSLSYWYECKDCGSVIRDPRVHDRFHAILDDHATAIAVLLTSHVNEAQHAKYDVVERANKGRNKDNWSAEAMAEVVAAVGAGEEPTPQPSPPLSDDDKWQIAVRDCTCEVDCCTAEADMPCPVCCSIDPEWPCPAEPTEPTPSPPTPRQMFPRFGTDATGTHTEQCDATHNCAEQGCRPVESKSNVIAPEDARDGES
jgi:hypothetical protein